VISTPGSHTGGPDLAHAELLEAKSPDDVNRARAAQLVSSALDAMGTAKSIRQLTEPGLAGS
jgi:hypothetical protein